MPDNLNDRPSAVAGRMRDWLRDGWRNPDPKRIEDARAIMEAAIPHLVYRVPDRSDTADDRCRQALQRLREIAALSAGYDDLSGDLTKGDQE